MIDDVVGILLSGGGATTIALLLIAAGIYLLFVAGNLVGLVPLGFVALAFAVKRFIGGDE